MKNAILTRTSTRTFLDKYLTSSEITKIINIVEEHKKMKGPFNNSFELTFNINDKKETNGKKVGTYGLLKNVPAFIGGVCKKTSESIIDFGFVFEKLILALTLEGFDTCWLGGTFSRKSYRRKLATNEVIPAISPVGYKAKQRSLIDRSIRGAAQSKNRLNFHDLFKHYDMTPIFIDMQDPVIEALSLVRRGPSASNKQPWRMFIDGDNVHLYIKRSNLYNKVLSYDIQLLDIGIAMSHFQIGLDSYNKKYEIYKEENPKDIYNLEYIISYKISK